MPSLANSMKSNCASWVDDANSCKLLLRCPGNLSESFPKANPTIGADCNLQDPSSKVVGSTHTLPSQSSHVPASNDVHETTSNPDGPNHNMLPKRLHTNPRLDALNSSVSGISSEPRLKRRCISLVSSRRSLTTRRVRWAVIYIYIYIYTYIYISICRHTPLYLSIPLSIYISPSLYLCIALSLHLSPSLDLPVSLYIFRATEH